MAALRFVQTVTLCAAAVAGVSLASPVIACEPGRCETGTEAKTKTASKPLKLKNHMRKPVASSATRSVKRNDGEYRKVAFKRRAKTSEKTPEKTSEKAPAKTRAEPRAEVQPELPPISPAAASAFASYELARVRVISPELIEESRLLADLVANSSAVADDTTIIGIDSVQVVQSSEVNDIDLKADTPYATSLDALSRDLAGSRSLAGTHEPKDDTGLQAWLRNWLHQALLAFGSAFAGLTALVRIFLG
jgi:hypothetical protein